MVKQKGVRINGGHLISEHYHMMMSVPPKYPVAQIRVENDLCVRQLLETDSKNLFH